MTTPSEMLNRAADLIRDTAAKADQGPWQLIPRYDRFGNHVQSTFVLPPKEPKGCRVERGVRVHETPNYEWISLMSPVVAPHLEAIFRHAALAYGMDGDSQQDENALALARAVLGYPEETT